MPQLPMHEKKSPAMSRTQPKRRMWIYTIILLAVSWSAYALYIRVSISQATAEQDILQTAETNQVYLETDPDVEISSKKHFIQLMDLPNSYLPETGKHRRAGRLVVVGDVHGMKESLIDLLDKVAFNQKHDHLILAGDMISKGPDSKGVVDLAMKLGATAVRGNHEDSILEAYEHMTAANITILDESESEDNAEGRESVVVDRVSHKDRKLVKKLGNRRIRWLKACPVILRVGKLGKMGEVVVVHGGLAPGVKLEKQDPVMVMNMRTIGKHGKPSDERDGMVWIKPWNELQKSLPRKSRTTVIYGHDSHRGLQIKKYSMGIDTACLKGGKLTAVVIEGGPSDHTHKIVHVNCKEGRV